jgi:hypothetical protein
MLCLFLSPLYDTLCCVIYPVSINPIVPQVPDAQNENKTKIKWLIRVIRKVILSLGPLSTPIPSFNGIHKVRIPNVRD